MGVGAARAACPPTWQEEGSRLTRQCWCKDCVLTCPTHTLGKWIRSLPAGHQLFPGITAHRALQASCARHGLCAAPCFSRACQGAEGDAAETRRPGRPTV